jgi:hypothetical protein
MADSEKESNTDALIQTDMISEACNGDQAAEVFCRAFHCFCHSVDDAIDRDNPEFTAHSFILALLGAFNALTFNVFYLKYSTALISLITQAFIAWEDSMRWSESSDIAKQRDANVIKGYYHEVFFFVAYLCGGAEHALQITAKYRKYDHEEPRG